MNGGELILNRIQSDCDASVAAIAKDADSRCESILAEARAQAEKNAAALREQGDRQLSRLDEASKSRAGLEARNMQLKARRAEIDKTVDALKAYLLGLGDSEYFDALYRLMKKLGGKSGTLFLNQKDLGRLPADFAEQTRAAGLNADVSAEPADIAGGFILKSGDIEENMDFAAIITAKRDEIEDLINRELFSE